MHSEVPQIVREREAAKMLGVSIAALRRWRPGVRADCALHRIQACGPEEFLSRNTVYSTQGSHE
jgi:hypothetical protein